MYKTITSLLLLSLFFVFSEGGSVYDKQGQRRKAAFVLCKVVEDDLTSGLRVFHSSLSWNQMLAAS